MIMCPMISEVVWYYEKFSPHPISTSISSGSSLFLKNTKTASSGSYFCVGIYNISEGNPKYLISKSNLYIHG